VWTPPADLAAALPAGFVLRLRCLTSPDGLRRFYPLTSFDGLVGHCFLGGLALLPRLGEVTPERLHSYRAMWFLFQRVRGTREHLGNDFAHAGSLELPRSARGVVLEPTILPESVGPNREGQGEAWGIPKLLQEGGEEAREKGIARPTAADQVLHGLARAARRNPLYIGADEVPALIRMALYDTVEGTQPVPDATRNAVLERLLEALEGHRGDASGEFDPWFSGPKNSLVTQLAKKKCAAGGVLSRDTVRRALQDLGWQSYAYVADCVHVMMRVFQRLLPQPLTEAERPHFEQLYLKQPHFGQMPFALVIERFGFLKGAFWELLEKPDRDSIAVLHRLLAYYNEMALKRREVDRRVQAKRNSRGGAGKLSVECSLDVLIAPPAARGEAGPATDSDEDGAGTRPPAGGDGDEVGTDPVGEGEGDRKKTGGRKLEEQPKDSVSRGLWADLAERVREAQKVRCDCLLPDWEDHTEDPYAPEVTITHCCRRCGHAQQSRLPLARLQEIAAAGLRKR
jgi:hypothetical protein